MATIALLAAPGKILGFLLFAGDGSLLEGPSERDCIFSGVPFEAALLNHELSIFLQDHKNGEFQCRIKHNNNNYVVTVPVTKTTSVQLQFPSSGLGSWHVQHGANKSIQGVCELVPA